MNLDDMRIRLGLYYLQRKSIIKRRELLKIIEDTDFTSNLNYNNFFDKITNSYKVLNSSEKLMDLYLTIYQERTEVVQLVESTLKTCIDNDISISAIFDETYPKMLNHSADKPIIIFHKGKIDEFNEVSRRHISVIGTRKMSAYGERFILNEFKKLRNYNLIVISGLARGVDSLAHKEALRNNIFTVACLAHGLNLTYPAEHKQLKEEIAENGLLISEHAPEVRAIKQYFPARNRIISALSEAVLVVEAGEKSGTLITCEFAAMQGRDVLAVPGSIYAENSKGCNKLIRDGAILIRNAQDIIEYLGLIPRKMDPFDIHDDLDLELIDKLSMYNIETLKDIVLILAQNSFDEVELQNASGLSSLELRTNIVILESIGLVSSNNGKYFLLNK